MTKRARPKHGEIKMGRVHDTTKASAEREEDGLREERQPEDVLHPRCRRQGGALKPCCPAVLLPLDWPVCFVYANTNLGLHLLGASPIPSFHLRLWSV